MRERERERDGEKKMVTTVTNVDRMYLKSKILHIISLTLLRATCFKMKNSVNRSYDRSNVQDVAAPDDGI